MQDTTKQKLKIFGARVLEACKRNYLMLLYAAAVLLVELTGVAVTSGKFYMTEPWLYFSFIALPCIVSLYLTSHNRKYALFLTALVINFILDMVFIVIYDSTGTVFDYAMLNLRTDAMMIVESLPISFTYVFVTAIIISLYGTLGHILKKRMPAPKKNGKAAIAVTASLLAAVVAADTLLVYFTNYENNANDLSYRLYRKETGTYSNKGIIGNLANELARGLWFSDIEMGDVEELEEFIYAETTEPTDMFGKAEGFNVVTVLCESFEWFTFLMDAERYPNGYAKALLDAAPDDRAAAYETLTNNLRELYPNLYRLYDDDSTVILNNSHSLEKTDISENKSIIGNYPLYQYINYAYPTNTLPYSLPNIMRSLFGVTSKSFHDGYKTFYNRNIHHTNALGFESYTAAEDMAFEDDDTGLGERNLDSLMFESCKTEMFPTDRRFNTFVTTITMHGQYAYRENLKPYYDKMDALGVMPFDKDDEDANALRYYCAAGMDFDKAIGIMLDYLDENGLADNTLITLFGDHNSYYQGISNYVKKIYSYDVENYTELYRVPVMMRVGNVDLQSGETGHRIIEKFTCVADIYPTILDLLGVKGFKNLMYGVSAFSDETSVLYSRAYDKFITDKLYYNSLNHIIYRAPDADEKYIEDVTERSLTLLDKISHVNRIFAGDYFKGDNAEKFYDALRAANSAAGNE